MTEFFECLGWIAAICTTVAFIPQVLQVLKNRSAKDISLSMYLIFSSGVFMWIIYGLHIKSIPIVLANIITFGLASAILVMKILWSKNTLKDPT